MHVRILKKSYHYLSPFVGGCVLKNSSSLPTSFIPLRRIAISFSNSFMLKHNANNC